MPEIKKKERHYEIKNNPKSEFEYFDIMYQINEALIQIITLNFGFDSQENKVEISADFTAMTKRDQATILWLAEKYGIKIINTPYTVLEFFKNWMLNTFKSIADNIISANSIYPNTEYEFNIKRKYITDAMNYCEVLIQIVQMTKTLFKCDEDKLVYFASLIIKQRNRLKNWKAHATKLFYEQSRNNGINILINNHPNIQNFIKSLDTVSQDQYLKVASDLTCPIKIINSNEYCGFLS